MNKKQFLDLIDCFYIKKYEPVQQLIKVFKILTGISWRKFFCIKATEVAEYLYLVEDFLKLETPNITRQLMPCYRKYFFQKRLYGPDTEISNLIMSEFTLAEHYFQLWNEERENVEYLNQFIAVIYRPAKERYNFSLDEDGDCRVKLNENVAKYHAKKYIRHWPLKIKLAISLWYGACRQQMVDENEEVFGGGSEPAKYGLVSLMLGIAEKGRHGTFAEVEQKNIHLMMMDLTETILEAKRQEAALKSSI